MIGNQAFPLSRGTGKNNAEDYPSVMIKESNYKELREKPKFLHELTVVNRKDFFLLPEFWLLRQRLGRSNEYDPYRIIFTAEDHEKIGPILIEWVWMSP